MTTQRKKISRLSALVMGGLLAALPATAALAAEPATAEEAQAKAVERLDDAAYYSSLGGVGYKTGLEQRAEADAARYQAQAAELAAPPTAAEAAASRHADDVRFLRALGGVTYKTGQVQRHEAAAAAETTPAATQPNPSCNPTKPVQDVACANEQQ
jgi:hypothetical protein